MDPITVTRTIDAPLEEVWEAMTDLDTMPERIAGITHIERLTPHTHIQVGARWKETRTMFGREATEEMYVTSLEGRTYVVESEGHGARYRSEFALSEVDGGTEVTMSFDAVPLTAASKLMSKVTGPMARRAVQRTVATDLDDLAAHFSG